MTDPWRPLIAKTVRIVPCRDCGALSGWHPKGWWYRYVPTPGGGRHGRRVRAERLCPVCSDQTVADKVGRAYVL
jgi:hypothetical protein